mgnify:CR=1 FL=1
MKNNIIIGTRGTAKIEQKQRIPDVFGYFRLETKKKKRKKTKNSVFVVGLKKLIK